MSLTNSFSLKKSHHNYFNLFCHALALAVMSVLQNHHRLIKNKRLISCRLQFVICTISCNRDRKLCLQIAGAGQALTNPLILHYCGLEVIQRLRLPETQISDFWSFSLLFSFDGYFIYVWLVF